MIASYFPAFSYHAKVNFIAIIIDGTALINQKSPGAVRTFDEYATEVVLPVLHSYSRKDHRTDLVFDTYISDSLKASTREKRGTGIVSNTDIDKHELSPCTHEEADTRLFLHAKDISKEGNRKISISSSDTDVVVIAVACFSDLNIEKLWLAFACSFRDYKLFGPPLNPFQSN